MSYFASNLPSFRAEAIISPPVPKKTSAEIYKEQTHEQAKEALKKPSEERTVGDYMTIGIDTVHKITENTPVVYAQEPSKLNYMA